MKRDEQVLDELARAAEGLLFMSESDHPFETFKLEDAGAPVAERLRELSGGPEGAAVEELSPEEFFRAATSEPAWKGEAERALARRYQQLTRVLRENLSDVRVYKFARRGEKPAYVVGRSPEGNWLGLSTYVVET